MSEAKTQDEKLRFASKRALKFLADLNGSNVFDDSTFGKDMDQRARSIQQQLYDALYKATS